MNRRGLSLIEVLAATVLLAMMAGAFVPLMVAAANAMQDGEAAPQADELGLLADAVLAEPESFGLTIEQLRESDLLHVTWPDGGTRGPIHVRRLAASEPDASHAWLVFSCEDDRGRPVIVCRWIKLPSVMEGGQ